MAGRYGDFLVHFPELKRRIGVFSHKGDPIRNIIGILQDNQAAGLSRNKIANKRTDTIDIQDHIDLYISSRYKDKVHEGDYFYHPSEGYLCRIVKQLPFDYAAGYITYDAERVTGSTFDQDEELKVKEGYYA